MVAEKAVNAMTKPRAAATTLIVPAVQTAGELSVPGGMSREQAEMYQRRYGIRHGVVQPTQDQRPPPRPAEDVMSVSEICLAAAIALLLPTVGSITFWTLFARSTLGGMVFTAFSQLLAFGIVAFIVQRLGISDYRVGIRDLTVQTAIFALASVVYGGIFVRLSWRKFARLQVNRILPDTLAGSESLSARGLRLDWLRCRPTSPIVNLLRKEIQLQRPVFMIATILCFAWLLTYTFLVLQPSRTSFPEIVFALTIGFYIPLMSFLAGSISLGEEKNLGITAWHLTFPVAVWRQWSVKLVVGLVTWILLGLLLPFGLIRLGLAIRGPRIFTDLELQSWLGISLFATGVFAMSFWAMTLFSNTVRAVLGTLATVLALCSFATFAYWLVVELILPNTFLQTLLINDARWQGLVAWVILGAIIVLLALVQSLIQFGHVQTSRKTSAKHFCTLMAFTFTVTACSFFFAPLSSPTMSLLFFALLLWFIWRIAMRSRASGLEWLHR
jgi:hypothetical protein